VRPRELTLQGFRSYKDATTFGWEGRGLVGVVGPIGSGKSSILDAIAFALYNKTPRIERDTKSLINQRADTAHVSLTFEVDGEVWKTVRALRRGGASSHNLYRVVDGEDELVLDRATDVTQEVERLLGLDFEAFRRSVLLAQNQFAAFLEATGTERNKVLKGVFGFDRLDAMRDVVKSRLDEATGRLAGLETRRKTAEQDRKDLDEARTAMEKAERRREELDALRQPLKEIDDLAAAAAKRKDAAREALERLDGMLDRIPGRDDTEGLLTASRQGASAVAEAEAAVEVAATERDAAGARRTAVLERYGSEQGLEAAGDAVGEWRAARDRAERERASSKGREAAVIAATDAVAAAEKARAAAEKDRTAAVKAEERAAAAEQKARDALHAAHETDRVAAVRSTLAEGEACPVCEQVVATLPDDLEASDVSAADEALRTAVESLGAARTTRSEADAVLAARTAEAEAAKQRLDEAGTAREAAAKALADAEQAELQAQAAVQEVLGDGDPEQALAKARTAVQEATTALAAANAALERATKERDAARKSLEESRIGIDRLRTEVAGLAGSLGAEIDLGDDAGALESGLTALREAWLAARTAADEARAAAEKAQSEQADVRARLMEEKGLAAADDLVEVLSSARSEVTAAGTTIDMLEKRLAQLEALAAEEQEVLARHGLLTRLHADLAPSKFLEFVLQERRRVLSDLAGVHFETLSAGRYRFSDDGEFAVVDISAAEAVRAPSSLSGGETFLASLALALALAEIVAREGGRLDAFFLDEGFGSLDPEHLDLAMDGIERLVSEGGDRLVVVVSHVPALTQRIEDLIVLGRDELTGDTRVLQGAIAP
jgi:exonuclease SbcC